MIVVGLTGGIGAGKSTFAALLGERGAEVVDVDAIGRDVIAPGTAGADAVQARFGTVDRRELAAIVFNDETARQSLEAISWPRIEDELRRRVAGATTDVVVLDMAVLPQGLGLGTYDTVVTVESPEPVRLERLVSRGMSREDAIARMASQVDEDERRALASFVIDNDGDLANLRAAADALVADLQWQLRATVLHTAADAALAYAASVDARPAAPDAAAIAALAAFDEPLPDVGLGDGDTIALLDRAGSPATMASTAAHYFGFVNGATLPVALGASWIASAWDQNAALPVMSPVAAKLHAVVQSWLVDLLRLPPSTGVAFVSGATVANASCLAAARDALLARLGWDVQANGLFGAPQIPVVVGARAHSTLSKSLGLVGLGRERVLVVPADDQGRMRADLLPRIDGPVLLCAQAGEVNTGAFDPFDELAVWLAARGGWLHVDGAFGLWALADPSRASLVRGLDRADSWATDGHKWLNVTYDCGMAFVRDLADLRRTFSATAGYLPASDEFEAMHHTPQSSQRARQVEVWAVLRALGRAGIAALVADACAAATVVAERLRDGGLTVLNDVVLNQVLVRCGDGPTTDALVTAVQADGRVWCGPTQWDGATAMRISVSSWKTTVDDAAYAADVILACAAALGRS